MPNLVPLFPPRQRSRYDLRGYIRLTKQIMIASRQKPGWLLLPPSGVTVSLIANEPFGLGATLETLYRRHQYRIFRVDRCYTSGLLAPFETGIYDDFAPHIRMTYDDMVWLSLRV